jgi:aldehyde dehydrogenase (NAD+)
MTSTVLTARPEEIVGPRVKRMLIDGEWVPAVSGETFQSINPSTGEVLAEFPLAGAEDVDRAVRAARKAFDDIWSRTTPGERQRLLLAIADIVDANYEELATLDSLDFGGPITRTRGGRNRALSLLRYYAGLATSVHGETIPNSLPGNIFSYTVKVPVGVVGAIIPWNGPATTAIWKIAPAIAMGCTVVLKPSEESSLSALRLGELMLDAGLPAGVVNVVTGGGATGAAIARHPDIDKIAFTGSTATGQKIIEASAGNVKRLSMELGGKSPDIVFADADLDKAVPGAAMAVFQNSGQICSAGTRLFVEQSIYPEFMERVAAYARTLRVGPSLDPDTVLGPLVSAAQLEKVTGYLEAGTRSGARVLTGGARLGGELSAGYFVAPTVFVDVDDSMSIAREEIFGPVLSAMPFTDVDEVIARANNTPYGLGSGVWTRDVGKAHRVARELQAGTVWVNCYQAMDAAIPFGGVKMSGFGRESGIQHVEEFLEVKSVIINTD